MKSIKTYEGFFDFLKKKEKKEPVKFEEVMECLYDLTDEHRIKNRLNGVSLDNFDFVENDVVFKNNLSWNTGNNDSMNAELYNDKNFRVKKNAIAFRMSYKQNEISDSEVNELLLDCASKLEMYGCKLSFFISWGVTQHSRSDKEWTDFMKMVNSTINKTDAPDRARNITVKITSPSGFN